MRKSLLIFAAASLLLAGCAKEQPVEKELSNVVVTEVSATFEDLIPDGATKASVDISGSVGKFSWQGGDEAAFILDSKKEYGRGTYNENNKKFSIVGIANDHHDAVYPYDLVGSTSPSTENVNSITVPASRAWAEGQTNVSMYGSYSGSSYTFKHLGGLVKVKVVNVPVEAKTFVFKTAGKKINGTFNVVASGSDKVINTSSLPASGEDTYTLNLNVASANTTMDFYVPLPVGEDYVFSFYLKDSEGKDLAKVEGSTEYDVARKSILVMPTITLTAVDAGIEDTEKAAVVQEVPAGHSGDFLLANSEKVLLKVNASEQNKDITLKYNGGELPTNLEIQVVGDKAFDKTISGDLPKTHVDFTQGEIANVEMTTSASTFEIVYPAKISEKLTVKGGNVKVKGATVAEIEVAENAKADGDKAPVEIVVEEKGDNVPAVTNGIKANADVVVAPAENVTVKVTTEGDAKVANGGAGTVIDKDNNDIDTKAAAKIGDIKYITLADAIAAVKNDETISIIENKISATAIPTGSKKFTIDLGNKEVTVDGPAVGSSQTMNQAFQINRGNTITIKNGTIKCENSNNIFRFVIQNYADLTLEDVTVDGTNLKKEDRADAYTVSSNFGTITFAGNTTVKASTVSGVDSYAIDLYDYSSQSVYPTPAAGVWNSDGSVDGIINIGGGKLTVSKTLKLNKPIKVYKGDKGEASNLIVNASIIPVEGWTSANNGGDALVVVKRGGNLSIEGTGKISYNNQTGVYAAAKVTEKGESSTGDVAKLSVGGSVTLEGYYYGIVGNGDRSDTEITVNGGTIKGVKENDCTGIYHPQKGKLTINGGTIIGSTGIYVKSGDVEASISAGTIKGVGTSCKAYDPAREGDGCDPTGDALVIDNCGYPGGAPTVEIKGGTFISDHYKAVASCAKTGYPIVTGFIKGGTFSDLSGVEYVADNATYTLGADVANAAGMTLDTKKTFTVDFGGHTYTVNKPGAGSTNTQTQAFQLIAGQNITFKNGTIKAADANLSATSEGDVKPIKRFIQNYANLTLTNMTFDGTNINDENSVVEFCNGNVTIDGTTNFTAKSGVASINVDSWKGSYPNGTAVTINTTGNVGKIHCYTEGTGSMTTKSSLTIENGKNITIDDVSNGEVVISIEGGTFSDLSGVKYIADNKTYTLGANVTNAAGMAIDTKKTFTLDFGGHTYTVNKPGAGSTNTQTLAFQLLANQNITFKNGTIKAAQENRDATDEALDKKPIKRFIQNYANLTLTDMTLDGTYINGNNSVVEFCNGTVTINGSTNFTAKTDVASINVDSWTDYPNGTDVTINTTGKVGKIYCYSEGSGQMTTKSKLTIVSGEDITIEHKTEGDVDVVDQRTK